VLAEGLVDFVTEVAFGVFHRLEGLGEEEETEIEGGGTEVVESGKSYGVLEHLRVLGGYF